MYAAIYRYCSFGQLLLKLLWHEASESIVGTNAIGPLRVMSRGREIHSGVASHIALLPAHRKVRPVLFLMRALVRAGEDRFEVLYGLPNDRGSAACRLAGYTS